MATSEINTDERIVQANKTLDWDGINFEKIRALKAARGALKGQLTKIRNKLDDLTLDFKNEESVKQNIIVFENVFGEFETSHKTYREILCDEVDRDESEEYFHAEEKRFVDTKRKMEEWLFSVKVLSRTINPDDSVSNMSSHKGSRRSKSNVSAKSKSSAMSSLASTKIKVAARKAALEVEANKLQKYYYLKQEELRLEQSKRELELETEIAKAEAEEKVYTRAEALEINDNFSEDKTELSFMKLKPPQVRNFDTFDDKWDSSCFITRDFPFPEPLVLPAVDVKAKQKLPQVTVEDITFSPDESRRADIRHPVKLEQESHRDKEIRRDNSYQQMMLTQMQQTQQIQQLLAQQQQQTLALTLPQPEIPVFRGDAIEYCGFIRAFENLIESKTLSGSARLYYLVQYTSGDVQELVRSCLTMDGEAGYIEARRLLKERYGQSYKIATAFVEKLTKGPAIKGEDGTALHRFAILLTSCKNTLKEIGYLSKVENSESLKNIVSRLPFALQRKFREVADRITQKEKREITIEDLATFVSNRARVETHPVFGSISFETKNNVRGKDDTPKGSHDKRGRSARVTFATNQAIKSGSEANSDANQASAKVLTCPLCEASHWLSQCSEFKKMDVEERFKFARSKKLCDNCLVPGHFSRQCRKPSFCKVDGCTARHSTFLHPKSVFSEKRDNSEEKVSKVSACKQDSPKLNGAGSPVISLAIVPVKVKAEGCSKMVETYAFLDSGSNTTFCTDRLMKELGIQGSKTVLSLTTMHRPNNKIESSVTSLEVFDLNEENLIELPVVFSTPSLPVTSKDILRQEDVDKWPHLKGVELPAINAHVGLLIGSDVPRALEPKELRECQSGGPFATRTQLGWVINGPLRRIEKKRSHTANFIQADMELSQQFSKFCNMEFNDSLLCNQTPMSVEDKHALRVFEESSQLVNGHYEIAIPWKNYPPDLENNKTCAIHRLAHTKKKLLKDATLHRKYSDFMDDLLDKHYAEKVEESQLQRADGRVWYLPHHSVLNPQKPDKTRIVFDCAASYKGASLNDQVLQGPDLTNSLVGVLIRFREEIVAVMADIEAMFHQVRVCREDIDSLRFLWFPENDLDKEPQVYRMLVHLFGGVWSPSCANFALRKIADDNKLSYDKEIITAVKKDFYVDDLLKSLREDKEAIHLVKQLTDLLRCGGFHLTKWISNRRSVLESIPVEERAKDVKELNLDRDKLPMERALGCHWNVETDQFSIKVKLKERPSTRRGLLSIVSSVYDPLGFVSPFIFRAKVILQHLCKLKLGWDDPIPADCLEAWKHWLEELHKLEDFSVNRCYKPDDFGNIVQVQLHHFADASEVGYGAVSYIRQVNDTGDVYCSFILGKSRLAPLKTMTIPRMELSAAAVAVRLDKMIKNEMNLVVDETTFWTDSTIVLRYIRNERRRFNTFVANRIAVIHDTSSPGQWRHVDGKLNPADDASRGLSADELLNTNRWISGPGFLWHKEESWPKEFEFDGEVEVEEDDPEVKKKNFIGCVTISQESTDVFDNIINRFSTWDKLLKFVSWMLRYRASLLGVSRARKDGLPRESSRSRLRPIDADELENAENEILKFIQKTNFSEEIQDLADSTLKKSSKIYKLDPFATNGLLCVGGRLKNAPIPSRQRNPVIVPKSHHIVTLIIRHYHIKSGHSGLEYVLSMIRERFWIVNGRVAVKKVLRDCFSCKRRQASPGEQKMADLPVDRVTPYRPPFTFVGVDCFGPFEVKRGRSLVKRYGVLFTCLSIRAIHIEVAHSLDTSSFIDALRRFICRRGEPEEMRSDNGGNFVAGEKELRDAVNDWNQEAIHASLLKSNVKWIFNPPAGSHFGGVWERCIRTVRKVLNALLKQQTLYDEGLQTLMCEVESIVNSRPITKVSDDPKDLQALTPSHLLLLRSGPTLPPGVFEKEHLYARKRWRQVQYMADLFWSRWTKEYLPTLQKRQKWSTLRRNFAVGDVVLVVDQAKHRCFWPLGRIMAAHPNRKDGLVRSVTVKTRTSVLDRPIDKIVLLEAVEALEAK